MKRLFVGAGNWLKRKNLLWIGNQWLILRFNSNKSVRLSQLENISSSASSSSFFCFYFCFFALSNQNQPQDLTNKVKEEQAEEAQILNFVWLHKAYVTNGHLNKNDWY